MAVVGGRNRKRVLGVYTLQLTKECSNGGKNTRLLMRRVNSTSCLPVFLEAEADHGNQGSQEGDTTD